jgi:hypothetical protein
MSGGIEPLEESRDEPPRDLRERPRLLSRLRYALALVWVTVGLVLFLIEAVGLAVGRG